MKNTVYRLTETILIVAIVLSVLFNLNVQQVMAQTANITGSSLSSSEGAKVLVEDVIQALKNNDTRLALVHLNILNQHLTGLGNSSSSVQSAKVLVDDATDALKVGNISKGLAHMDLVKQQLSNSSVSFTNPSIKAEAFAESYGKLVTDSRNLTQTYQSQVGKWKLKQYDNGTMISITDQYLPKFQSLVDRAKALQPPQKFMSSRDLLALSFQSEIESYKHFRNFLTTGLKAEDDLSTKFLSDALRYETDSFSEFNSAQ